MVEEIKLAGRVRVFVGRLYNHDYLWFSSNEISKVSATLPVLHNYALCYALSCFERGVAWGSMPQYAEDLAQMPLYVTPATAESAERTAITFNAIDSITLRTDIKPNVNTPDVGKRVYLNPIYEPAGEDPPRLGYRFYAFAFGRENPRSITRLGKKGCPIRVRWQEIEWPVARFIDEARRPSHAINPLDVSGTVVRFDTVQLPPHLLLRPADIARDWFIERGPHLIHVPRIVMERVDQRRV